MRAAVLAATQLVVAPTPIYPARSPRGLVILVAAAIAVFCIAVAAWWAWPNRNSPTVSTQTPASPQITPASAISRAPRLSIVVLPFTNLSNDPDQEYLVDGIADDLTTDLSRIDGSFVIARTTAFTHKGKHIDAKQIGHELGVRYVLEGSVRRLGDRVQVNVQLIDTETG